MSSTGASSDSRVRSSRQRPKSGYRVRPTVQSSNSETHSYHDEMHNTHNRNETSDTRNSYLNNPQSPRSSADSGIYAGYQEGHIENYPQHYSRPPSGRPPSSRPASRYDYDRSTTATPSGTSRPTSASSFSRYSLLPDIGHSAANTPEPYINHGNNSDDHERGKQRQYGSKGKEKLNSDKKPYKNDRNYETDEDVEKAMEKLKIASKNESIVESKRLDGSKSQQKSHNNTEVINIPTESNVKSQETVQSHKDASNISDSDPIQSMFPALKRKVVLPAEPNNKDKTILLAVKLPSGERVHRHFRLADTLLQVLRFSEYSSKLDFTGCELVCDAPRQVFKDLNIKISETQLENRTVLHIQIPID